MADSPDSRVARLAAGYKLTQFLLPRLSDGQLAEAKRNTHRSADGVAGFLADFAIDAEEQRRDRERWKTGRNPQAIDADHVKAVIAATPRHVHIDPEALVSCRLRPANRYRIDRIVGEIMGEIADRLPRTLAGYSFFQDSTSDILDVPGIGKITVEMYETKGVFRRISSIECDKFRIWNCRDSGIIYRDRYIDNSRPQDIVINPIRLRAALYSDNSGIFVGNGRKALKSREAKRQISYVEWLGWETMMIRWLYKRVLSPLLAMPKPQAQIAVAEAPAAYPENAPSPVFAFIEQRDINRVRLLRDNPEHGDPDERYALDGGYRLMSLGTGAGGLGEIGHAGFVWCMTSEPEKLYDLHIGKEYAWEKGLARIEPKSAQDVYVVDWSVWQELAHKGIHSADDEALARRTFVPVGEYKGDFVEALVLIGRKVALDEVVSVRDPEPRKRYGL